VPVRRSGAIARSPAWGARPHEHEAQDGAAAVLGRQERTGRGGHERERHAEVVGRLRREVAQDAQHGGGVVERPEHGAAEDERPDGVQRVLERGRDAEVPAAAAQAPEELGLAVGGRAHPLAAGGDEVDGAQVVDGKAMAAHEVAEAAAEREPADPGVADHAAGGGEPGTLRGVVELAPQHAARRTRGARLRVHPHRLHERQVDHHAVVGDGVAGDGMTAATDGDAQVLLAREAHGGGDVVGAGAARDERGPAVDRAVPHAPGFVVALLAGT
jgi:hypothetical protein